MSDDVTSPHAPPPTVWHSLSCDDARAEIEFLTQAFGFVANGVYASDDNSSTVHHAQLDWPPGGGVMLGSRRGPERSEQGWLDSTGHAQCYCVTESDADVDRIHARTLELGGTSVRAPEDQDYGGRGCTVRDPEGNEWSFGSYRGEPRQTGG